MGLLVQLGDGANTSVYDDQWLPIMPPSKVSMPKLFPEMKVKDLWYPGTREWNYDILRQVLTPYEVELATTLYLSRNAEDDMYVWAFTKNMEFTVKSGYWVATHLSPADLLSRPPMGEAELKMSFWKLKINPKVQHFFWKVITGSLPTATRLITRKISIDPICSWCCLEEESINHVLFLCPRAQKIWRSSNLPLIGLQHPSQNLEENLRLLLFIHNSTDLDVGTRILPFWITWNIWKDRNDFIFNHKVVEAKEIMDRSLQLAMEWIDVNNILNINNRLQNPDAYVTSRDSYWEPPPSGWVKCNFDSSFRYDASEVGVGWIIRNEFWHHVVSGCSRLPAVRTSLQAECAGFLHVIQTLWIKGWRFVWFEGDNLELTELINKGGLHIELGNRLLDLRVWTRRLPEASLGHVYRERNQAADKLAHQAYDLEPLFNIFSTPPIWLQRYLYTPFTI